MTLVRNRFLVIITVLVIAGLLGACRPAAAPTQTAYPGPLETATVEPQATFTTEGYPGPETGTPPAAPGLYPPDIRTGDAALDAVLAAALANDTETLKSLLRYTVTACTTAQGAGGPPKCLSGERDGSLVEVFPVLGEEGEHVRRANIDAFLDLQIVGLYAIYQVPADAPAEDYWPAGDYALVFQGGGLQTSITLLVEDGAIVRINRLRRTPAEDVAAAGAVVFILAPLDGSASGAYPAP
jgi:hypothetical protein